MEKYKRNKDNNRNDNDKNDDNNNDEGNNKKMKKVGKINNLSHKTSYLQNNDLLKV